MPPADLWAAHRTFHHSDFPAERLIAERTETVSVCLPARNEAAAIGPIVECVMSLRERGIVDQVTVVDNSGDGTGDIAAGHGAEVYDQSSLLSSFGPVKGKGDAMWRALSVLHGDIVCFVDADSGEFGPHFILGLIGPVICAPRVQFVKGFYRRPWKQGEVMSPTGGGRVTELVARPLLHILYPELSLVRQPLAGEIAARRDLLEQLPFTTGYGVDIGLLIDAWRSCGLERLAQVDLDVRQNRHRPLPELNPMAESVLGAVLARLTREGRLVLSEEELRLLPLSGAGNTDALERPPLASLPLTR